MSLTLTPRLRTVPELDSLAPNVPAEGVERADIVRIPVIAKGTAGGEVDAWLQSPAGEVGRTTLAWNSSQLAYEGVLTIPASAVVAGAYPVTGLLRIEDEESDQVSSVESVRIVEPAPPKPRGVPAAIQDRVASFHSSFGTNSDLLMSTDDAALQQLARDLLPYADLIEGVVVQGHCDARGPAEFNDVLGGRRAGTVANTLRPFLQNRIAVSFESLGETMADQAAHDDASWQQDRWARLQLKEKGQPPSP